MNKGKSSLTNLEKSIIVNEEVGDEIQTIVKYCGFHVALILSGERYISEKYILACAIRSILKEHNCVSNKSIILYLIHKLEGAACEIQKDILRNTLQMVVGITPDDLG